METLCAKQMLWQKEQTSIGLKPWISSEGHFYLYFRFSIVANFRLKSDNGVRYYQWQNNFRYAELLSKCFLFIFLAGLYCLIVCFC